MRLRGITGPDVDAVDSLPWDMPLASAVRPFSVRALTRLTLASAFLFLTSGLAGWGYALALGGATHHESMFLASNAVAVGSGLALGASALLAPRLWIRAASPVANVVLQLATPLLVSALVWSAGPDHGLVALAYVEAPLFAFYMLRRRWAVAAAAWVLACFAFVVAVGDGWTASFWAWLFLAANVIGTGVVMGLVAARNDQLAAAEHEARVELADLNVTLEQRVDAQVSEIERLNGLRRFLSPQVADVVLAEDSTHLSQPHRSRIAVFFCDLRGFSAFTNGAEPEEVVEVLDLYYRTVGGLLQSYDATVGGYAGDGIMAYFGDPVPREDSALAAVRLAAELRTRMADVVAQWRRSGYDLDYGVGIAYGFATLGVVGFDGRYDYTPIGGIVNLAARLCGRAGPGQVLVDHGIHLETSDRFPATAVADLDLKGFGSGTKAYLLT